VYVVSHLYYHLKLVLNLISQSHLGILPPSTGSYQTTSPGWLGTAVCILFLLLLRSSRPTNRCHRTDGLTPQAPVNEMPPAHQMGHPKVLLVKPGPRDQLVAPGRTKRQVLQILMVARYSIRPALGKPRLLAIHNSRLVNLVLSLVHSLTSVVRLSPSASTLAAGVKSHFPIVHLLAAY
jgi:hypothetical protein